MVDAATMRRSTIEMRVYVVNQPMSATPTASKEYEESARTKEKEARAAAAQYGQRNLGSREREQLAIYLSAFDAFVALRDSKLFPAGEAKDITKWTTIRDAEANPLVTTMNTALAALIEEETAQARTAADDAEAEFAMNRTLVIAMLAVGLSIAVAVAMVVARSLVSGIRRVQHVAEALAANDLSQTTGLSGRDEVGSMGAALDQAVVSLRSIVATIDDSATAVAAAAQQVSSSATHIASTAQETAAQADVVSSAAELVSQNVNTVASGTEEMSTSIREIAHNSAEATRIAARAVDSAASTKASVGRLDESSREIGKVVQLITTIAEQTNLLALNATIEAARAGEAGKGFAVVANEVKDLAQETARATDDIARRVSSIQEDTVAAVADIGEIDGIITAINDYQTTIAAAVEQQTATTTEISRSVTEAAAGSQEIAGNIAGVAEAATMTTRTVVEANAATVELARMSHELKDVVSAFRL